MNQRRRFLSLGLLLIPFTSGAQETPSSKPQARAVFPVISANQSDWETTLKNIDEFVVKAKPGTADVEVVAAAGGLKLVDKDSPLAAQVNQLLEQKVRFVACKTSMDKNKMPLERLHVGIGTVPSAKAEIESKKQLGWQVMPPVGEKPKAD